MTKRYFCTLFDSGYLIKGLAMIRSLMRWSPGAEIFVLCMDRRAQEVLEALAIAGVHCVALRDIETPELLEAKKDRGVAEYCWTLSPCLPSYVLEHHPEIDFITYIDSDLLFYSPPEPLFEEIGANSIAIIEHRFPPRLMDRLVNGRFCVEWVSFRRDEEGMACLNRWKAQCIEWCYYRLEENRMGDQKYLDEWPGRYPHCHILQHLGAGVAPWNYSQYQFGGRGDGITVDGQPLIFYHFHQFQLLDNGRFDRLSSFYAKEKGEPDAIYSAYEGALEAALVEIRTFDPTFSAGLKPAGQIARLRWTQAFVPQPVKRILKKVLGYRI
jgi:hypothetical protein